jgi:tetratricopeptide (TPR) repeat protein
MEKEMAYHEDKQGKMKRQASKQAIALAMQGRWKEAVAINKSIIQNFPNDVDAYNRLGKAYMELGEYAGAREAYTKALELDKYNTIARKNLERLDLLESKQAQIAGNNAEKAEPHLFIEEIGKAGVVNLYQVAPPERLIKMLAGDKVVLKPQDSALVVENTQGEYLGLVPAKHAQRLLKLMAGGNKYAAAVVTSNENSISIIIRETYQHPSQIDQVSFPARKLEEVQPFIGEKALREYEEEELGEEAGYLEEEEENPEETEELEEDKDWDQEA